MHDPIPKDGLEVWRDVTDGQEGVSAEGLVKLLTALIAHVAHLNERVAQLEDECPCDNC